MKCANMLVLRGKVLLHLRLYSLSVQTTLVAEISDEPYHTIRLQAPQAAHCMQVAEKNNFDKEAYDFGRRVFNNSFQRGNISLPPADLGKKMGRGDYREFLHDNLLELSMAACKQSLQDWGTAAPRPASISGLLTALHAHFPVTIIAYMAYIPA